MLEEIRLKEETKRDLVWTTKNEKIEVHFIPRQVWGKKNGAQVKNFGLSGDMIVRFLSPK
jgi:hypothetical protein